MSRAPSMRRLALLAAFVLVTPALSGCLGIGEDTDEGSDDGLDTKSRADVSSQTGGIEGVVTDEAVQAVENANVTLVEISEETQTAEDGSFAFSNLQPGTYTLRIEAGGFLPTERDIQVSQNEVTTIEVVLTHEPTVKPYSQQFEFKGFMECSIGSAGGVFLLSWNTCAAAGNASNSKATFVHDIEANAWQIVTEVTWEPNSPLADRFWVNEEPEGFNNAWKVAYSSEQQTPPVIARTDRTQLAGIVANMTAICEGEEDPSSTSNHVANPDAYCNRNPVEKGGAVEIDVATQTASNATVNTPNEPIGFFPVGAGAAIQQEFTIVKTVFYNAPACEDYSVVQENTCEQMDKPPEQDPYEEINGTGNDSSGNETR